jgi:hypothetical protein
MAHLAEAIMRGLLADRPTSGDPYKEGRLYYAEDTQTLYRDSGNGWENYQGDSTLVDPFSALGEVTTLDVGQPNQLLKVVDGAPAWVDAPEIPYLLAELSDVGEQVPEQGQGLVWDATLGVWRPGWAQQEQIDLALSQLLDVDTTSVAAGNVLAWNEVEGKWLPSEFTTGIGEHDHDDRYYTRAEVDDLLADAAVNRGQVLFTVEGEVALATGHIKIFNRLGVDVIIQELFLALGTPPAGSPLTAALIINGSMAASAQVTAGNTTGASGNLNITWANGIFITLDVTQIGSSIPGSNLSAHVSYTY